MISDHVLTHQKTRFSPVRVFQKVNDRETRRDQFCLCRVLYDHYPYIFLDILVLRNHCKLGVVDILYNVHCIKFSQIKNWHAKVIVFGSCTGNSI